MKSIYKCLIAGMIMLTSGKIFAQGAVNFSCESPVFICLENNMIQSPNEYDFRIPGTSICQFPLPMTLWYTAHVIAPSSLFEIQCAGGMRSYTIYGPFAGPQNCCDAGASGIISSSVTIPGGSPPSYSFSGISIGLGWYYIKVEVELCNGAVVFKKNGSGNFECIDNNPCENCIGSFAPEQTKEYILSAWVKESNPLLTTTSYDDPTITLDFIDLPSTPVSSAGPFSASGIIIDGWQRIEQKFTVPAAAEQIKINLECASNSCYFDDIRIFPTDGSMKSYVYDPKTLRLMAELDERNYATKYEYDEEGKLVRIKKETERGVMTIQESKTSVIKQ